MGRNDVCIHVFLPRIHLVFLAFVIVECSRLGLNVLTGNYFSLQFLSFSDFKEFDARRGKLCC